MNGISEDLLQGQVGAGAACEIARGVALEVHLAKGGHFGHDVLERGAESPGGAVALSGSHGMSEQVRQERERLERTMRPSPPKTSAKRCAHLSTVYEASGSAANSILAQQPQRLTHRLHLPEQSPRDDEPRSPI